jgi:hypothetical protein
MVDAPKIKPFSVEKFTLHGCDPRKCRTFLHTDAQYSCPTYTEKGPKPCMISGFHCGVNEIFDLLGCCPTQIHSYRHFRTTYWSHHQGSSSPKRMLGTLRYAFIQGMVWTVNGSQRT